MHTVFIRWLPREGKHLQHVTMLGDGFCNHSPYTYQIPRIVHGVSLYIYISIHSEPSVRNPFKGYERNLPPGACGKHQPLGPSASLSSDHWHGVKWPLSAHLFPESAR